MSSFEVNPITGQLDLVGAGGASYINGTVATPADLPVTLGTPALDSVYLCKAASGVWLINRKPAGLYCRVANNGVAADWTYLGAFPEVNSDANWRIYNYADPTKEIAFSAAVITPGTTRTLTVPDSSGTLELTGHKSKHATGGSDALSPSDIGAAAASHAHSHNALSGLQGGGSGDYYHLPAGTADNQVATWDAATSTWAGEAPASGGTKTLARFVPSDNQPPASAYATLDTRNSIAVLDFDDATDESAVFVSVMPEGASLGSGLKIRLHWMATTATSGDVIWDVSLERMTTDLDSDSFDTIASATAAANGTSGILTVTELTLTTIDSVTAGDGFRLKVTRDANNGSDSLVGDAELVLVEVRSAV